MGIAYNYFKANSKQISSSKSTTTKDYHLQVQDLQGAGLPESLTLPAFIALCSGSLKKPIQNQMVILGAMSIGGTISKVSDPANVLQVCFDAGAKKKSSADGFSSRHSNSAAGLVFQISDSLLSGPGGCSI